MPNIPEDLINPLAGLEAEGASAAANAASSAASNILGLPTLSNTRNLVIRASKVIMGLLLIAIGFTKLLQIDTKIEEIAPVVAKGAAIG